MLALHFINDRRIHDITERVVHHMSVQCTWSGWLLAEVLLLIRHTVVCLWSTTGIGR